MVIKLLIKMIQNIERKLTIKNKTMLHYASLGNSLWIGELLISKGANINAVDNSSQKRKL